MRVPFPNHQANIDGRSPWSRVVLLTYAWTAVAIALGLGVGIYLAITWQASAPKVVAQPEGARQVAKETIGRLEAEQAELKLRIGELRENVASRQAEVTKGKSVLLGADEALETLRAAAGESSVRGPALRVTLDDSASRKPSAGDDVSSYIVHEYQLRDVLNVMWEAGAEAIAINGERIVASTSIYCVGSTIMVNSTRLSPPYEIVAAGDPAKLDEWLNSPAVLGDLKQRVKTYGLVFKAVRERDALIGPYTGSQPVRYATVSE